MRPTQEEIVAIKICETYERNIELAKKKKMMMMIKNIKKVK